MTKKGIFDSYLESADESQVIVPQSELADEFLGLNSNVV